MRLGVKHNIKENKSYFLTTTVVGWIDVFTRKSYRDIVINSLRHCIHNRGLNVYAYCIMPNHLHMIVNCNEPFQLKDTIRDFKRFTSKAIISEIINGKESRRDWMLSHFKTAGRQCPKNKNFKVWQTGNHAIELFSKKFTWTKVNYIHQNPVKAGFVEKSEDWIYSSAPNYAETDFIVLQEVVCLSPRLITI